MIWYTKNFAKLQFRSLTDVYYSGTSGSDLNVQSGLLLPLLTKEKLLPGKAIWHGSTIVSSICGKHEYGQELIPSTENIIKPIEYFNDYRLKRNNQV